jgi:hypothetical protein
VEELWYAPYIARRRVETRKVEIGRGIWAAAFLERKTGVGMGKKILMCRPVASAI